MPRHITNPGNNRAEPSAAPDAGIDPRLAILQMLMAQQAQGGGMPQNQVSQGRMPQGASDQSAPDEPDDMPKSMSGRDARFGPQDDAARNQTEGELDTVRKSMGANGPGDEDKAAIVEELRQAMQDDDREKVDQALSEMEDMGMSVEELPPDVQKQLTDYQSEDSGEASRDTSEAGESE